MSVAVAPAPTPAPAAPLLSRRRAVAMMAARWWTARRPRDAVSLLTVFLIPCFAIPSIFIVGPLGGGGTPANIVGMGLLAWWVLEKIAGGSRIDRQRQPLRLGVLAILLAIAASLVALHTRPDSGKEVIGAYRGLLLVASLFGIVLVAADGIPSIERAMVLLRRLVLAVAIISAIGILEFFTHINPGRSIPFPFLSRNAEALFENRVGFVRVQSSAYHPIELGALLGIMLPISVHCAMHTDDRKARRRAWVQVALIAAVLPMTLSRTGIIGAVIGSIALMTQWSGKQRLRALGVTAVFVAVLRVVTPGLVGSVTGMFRYFLEDSSTTTRTSRYGVAGDYFAPNPVFGRGYNTLFPATHQIFDNSYLYFAIETGVVGLLSLWIFFGTMFFVCRGIRLRTTDRALQDLGGLLSAVAFIMPIMFATADMMSFNMLMQTFFLLAGIGGALWRLTGGPQRTIIERSVRRPARSKITQ
jgi:hypothetical protein